MGTGRKGPIDQSMKKPKINKNKGRGNTWQSAGLHVINEEHNSPFLLSENFLAEMKQMSPQNVMKILLPK